jgi:hypothetical protein
LQENKTAVQAMPGYRATCSLNFYRTIVIKEDWLFTKAKGEMTVRIMGIAPAKEITDADGIKTTQPLFWIYYPDCRNFLAQFNTQFNLAGNSNNWSAYLDGRQFKSKIEKVAETKIDGTYVPH